MRLQKQKTREVNGKEYFRWTVVVPPGWEEGDELRASRKGNKLVIKKSQK